MAIIDLNKKYLGPEGKTVDLGKTDNAWEKGYIKDLYTLTGSQWNKVVNTTDLNSKVNVSDISSVAISGDYNDLTNKPFIPSALKNPSSITIQGNGTMLDSYDGSIPKTINITPNNIGAAVSDHLHDGRYYTKTAIDTALANKIDKADLPSSATSGSYNDLTDKPTIPTELKNPFELTIQAGGTSLGSYDGSAAKTINITANDIGASTVGHDHNNEYYTKSEVDLALSSKPSILNLATVATTGSYNDLKDLPNNNGGVRNPYSIIIQGNGNRIDSYDGSSQVTINITPDNIGAAPINHDHNNYINKDEYSTTISNMLDDIGLSTVATTGNYNDLSNLPEIPTKLKNPEPLEIQINGVTELVYDGSEKSVTNISLYSLGVASEDHLHDDRYVTLDSIDNRIKDHTHSYAGAAESGGSAYSAERLATNEKIGNYNKPVYFNNGIPIATSYTIESDVPEDAVFTDTKYYDFIGADEDDDGFSGLVPTPLAGEENKFLKADGVWSEITDIYGNEISENYVPNSKVQSKGSATVPVYFDSKNNATPITSLSVPADKAKGILTTSGNVVNGDNIINNIVNIGKSVGIETGLNSDGTSNNKTLGTSTGGGLINTIIQIGDSIGIETGLNPNGTSNGKTPGSAISSSGTSNANINTKVNTLVDRFDSAYNPNPGKILKINNQSKITCDDVVKIFRAAGTPEDIAKLTAAELSMQEIFSSWDRISCAQNGTNQNGTDSESVLARGSYNFDKNNNCIVCARNNDYFSAFMSNDIYAPDFELTYMMDQRIAPGKGGDNDGLFCIIGYMIDKNGKYHTLSIQRLGSDWGYTDANGNACRHTFMLCYDQYSAFSLSNGGLIIQEPSVQLTNTNWYNNYTKVKITKKSGYVKAETADPNQDDFNSAYTIEYTLPASKPSNWTQEQYDNIKYMMTNNSKIGFGTESNISTFKVLSSKNLFDKITVYDLQAGEKQTWQSGVKIASESCDITLYPNTLIYSVLNDKLFYYRGNGSFTEFISLESINKKLLEIQNNISALALKIDPGWTWNNA